jgi:hypothetical protein
MCLPDIWRTDAFSMPFPSCPANIWNDQKGDDMLSFRNKVIVAVVKFLFVISIAKPALQRIPVQMNHPFFTRRRR